MVAIAEAPPSGPRFSLLRPSVADIRRFVRAQREHAPSYDAVGATRERAIIRGDYNVDRTRETIGRGHETYQRAVSAVRRWGMFDLSWVKLCWPDTRPNEGSAVAVLAHLARGWILNAAKVVYVVDEVGDIDRFGFAYGTLPGHVLRGEERFAVEWDRRSDMVSFEIVAISRPHHVVSWLSYPVVRQLQRRFQRHAVAAIQKAVMR